MTQITPEEQKKQEMYRDARTTGEYNDIWQAVGKCVFCDLREKYIFFEENGVVMTISLYAYIDGNLMIIPRRHVRTVKELTGLEWETIRKFIYIAKKIIKDVHGIKGVQFVLRDGGIVAQSTVSDHLHFHAIPFDSPDLSVWNYRKLKYTPLENVAKYKADRKKIIEYGSKYEQRYRNASNLPVDVSLIAINTKREVLMGERADDVRLVGDFMTPPGGVVINFKTTLLDELEREVREETAFKPDMSNLKLVDTRIGSVTRRMVSKQLNAAYRRQDHFIWVTYMQSGIPADIKLTPGDDLKKLVWIKLSKVAAHPRITPEVKELIKIAEKML